MQLKFQKLLITRAVLRRGERRGVPCFFVAALCRFYAEGKKTVVGGAAERVGGQSAFEEIICHCGLNLFGGQVHIGSAGSTAVTLCGISVSSIVKVEVAARAVWRCHEQLVIWIIVFERLILLTTRFVNSRRIQCAAEVLHQRLARDWKHEFGSLSPGCKLRADVSYGKHASHVEKGDAVLV